MKWPFKLIVLFAFFSLVANAQEDDPRELTTIPDSVPQIIDSLYREDQFYVGLTFNFIDQDPPPISQSGFSGGFQAGFIRDFPLNKRRNVALGVGLGWAIDTFGHNLFIGQDENGESIFRSLDRDWNYDSNRFTSQFVELPIEFRWRSSTAETYKFWRIYGGLRLGYLYHFKSNFNQPNNQVIQNEVDELERFRMGATINFGFNTFNFHLYYGLNTLFEDAYVEEHEVGIVPVRVGLMFYIL